jgi:putative transposase
MRGVSVGYYQQKAELPGLKEAMPEYGEVNGQVLQDVVQDVLQDVVQDVLQDVLQDVVLRVERAYPAFFRRLKAGEKPGYPRFRGRWRSNCCTYPQVGDPGGARFDNGFLVLSKIGRLAVRWSRPLVGPPQDRPRPSR